MERAKDQEEIIDELGIFRLSILQNIFFLTNLMYIIIFHISSNFGSMIHTLHYF